MTIHTKKRIAEGFIALGVAVFFFTLVRAFFYAPGGDVPLAPEVVASISEEAAAIRAVTAHPVRLEIPAIKVDAKIQEVGVTKKGNMATPNNFVDVGWYKYGPVPGSRGSAVIAGHVDNGIALPAVFSKLKELKKGDDIYITTADGEPLHFKVTGTTEYDFNAKADEVFTDSSGKLLKLITCSGVWVQKYRTHDKRLVVSAVLAE